MHTVIILNKQSSDLLKDFRFLYKPFVDEGTISFCDWNEAGTDLKSAVPDIYKCIKGKPDWRAIVLNTDSMAVHTSGPVAGVFQQSVSCGIQFVEYTERRKFIPCGGR